MVVALALLLGSCGFHLRGDAAFPFSSIYVNVPTSPPMSAELTRSLASNHANVGVTDANAEVIRYVPVVLDDKDVLSL
jgi:LPS-assembly lipoprotein